MRFLVIASLIAITYSAELKSITANFTLLRVGYIFEFQFVVEIKENFFIIIHIILLLKSVHFKKPVTRSSFLSKSVVIFNTTTTNMTTLFERNEDRVTGFLN